MSDYVHDDFHRAYDRDVDRVPYGHDYSIRDVRDYDNIRGRGYVDCDRDYNNIHFHDGDDARDALYVHHDGDRIHSVRGRGVHDGDRIHNVHGDVRDAYDVYVL